MEENFSCEVKGLGVSRFDGYFSGLMGPPIRRVQITLLLSWLVNVPPPTYPPPEIAGLIKGLLTIGFP